MTPGEERQLLKKYTGFNSFGGKDSYTKALILSQKYNSSIFLTHYHIFVKVLPHLTIMKQKKAVLKHDLWGNIKPLGRNIK